MENNKMRDHKHEIGRSKQTDYQVSNSGSRPDGKFDMQREAQEKVNTEKLDRQSPSHIDKERQQQGTGTDSNIPVNEIDSRSTGVMFQGNVECQADGPQTYGKVEQDNNISDGNYSHPVGVDDVMISVPGKGNLRIIDDAQDKELNENRAQSKKPKHDASENVGTLGNKPENDKPEDQLDKDDKLGDSGRRIHGGNASSSPSQNKDNQNGNNEDDTDKQQALAKLRQGQTYDEEEDTVEEQIDYEAYDRAREKYVYFWQGYSVYSQWHKSTFYVDDLKFHCAEQFMMFKKAVLFDDDEIAGEILQCKDPRKIKSLGRQVRGFDPDLWQHNCLYIVKEGNNAKFKQNESFLGDILLTYPKVLVEASPFDRIWGIGLDEDSPGAWDEQTWQGTNYLGYVLTELRDDIMVERGMIDEKDREKYINNLMVDAGLPMGLSETEGLTQSEESNKSRVTEQEIYFLFFGGIYSQFHESFFEIDGKQFRCAEQYMMYMKAVLFKDFKIAEEILKRHVPREIKNLGRQVRGFNDETWHQHCLQFVKEGNIAKFSQNEHLKKAIVTTYPKIFAEANPKDRIWGIGLKPQDNRAKNKSTWHGKNFLGYVLTEVRDELMCQWGLIKKEKKSTYIDKLKEDWGTSVDDGSRDVNGSIRQSDHRHDSSRENKHRNRSGDTHSGTPQRNNDYGKAKTSHRDNYQKHDHGRMTHGSGHTTHGDHDKTPRNYHNSPNTEYKTHSDNTWKAAEKQGREHKKTTSPLNDNVSGVERKDGQSKECKNKQYKAAESVQNVPETDKAKEGSAKNKKKGKKQSEKNELTGHASKADKKLEKMAIEEFDLDDMMAKYGENHDEASNSPAKNTGKDKRDKNYQEIHPEEVHKAETDIKESSPKKSGNRRQKKKANKANK